MRSLFIVIAVLSLGGCATFGKEKAPTCDGKHRRPANLYGSTLDPTAPRAAKPDKLSAIRPSSYPSCGA